MTPIVCNRIENYHSPESTQSNCAKCDHPIWVSPASQLYRINHDAELICTICAADLLDSDEAPEVIAPTAEQMQEMANNDPKFKLLVESIGIEEARKTVVQILGPKMIEYLKQLQKQNKKENT